MAWKLVARFFYSLGLFAELTHPAARVSGRVSASGINFTFIASVSRRITICHRVRGGRQGVKRAGCSAESYYYNKISNIPPLSIAGVGS